MTKTHEPTSEEIASEAAKIREGWSEREHRLRAGVPEEEWTVPRGKTELDVGDAE